MILEIVSLRFGNEIPELEVFSFQTIYDELVGLFACAALMKSIRSKISISSAPRNWCWPHQSISIKATHNVIQSCFSNSRIACRASIDTSSSSSARNVSALIHPAAYTHVWGITTQTIKLFIVIGTLINSFYYIFAFFSISMWGEIVQDKELFVHKNYFSLRAFTISKQPS